MHNGRVFFLWYASRKYAHRGIRYSIVLYIYLSVCFSPQRQYAAHHDDDDDDGARELYEICACALKTCVRRAARTRV